MTMTIPAWLPESPWHGAKNTTSPSRKSTTRLSGKSSGGPLTWLDQTTSSEVSSCYFTPTKTFDPLLSVIPSPVYQKILARANLKPRRSVNTSVKYWRPCSKISWGFVHRCFEKATILKKIHTFCVSKNNLYIADYREELNSIYNYIFGGVWLPKKKN